ncbi:MAG: acetyl ornithine aminotransferase family protein [Candidatus Odinarchaeia archaeon]
MRTVKPKVSTPLPGPKSEELLRRDKQVVSTSYVRLYPLVIESGDGCIIRDADGNEFIDFASGVGVLQLGHQHPKVVEAIITQSKKLIHYPFSGFSHTIGIELAERIAKISPIQTPKICLTNSGTESVETAIKLVRWHTKRPRLIAFIGAFHGRTYGSLSCTADKTHFLNRFFPLVPGVTHVPYPYCYRCAFNQTFPECNYWCIDFIKEHVLDQYVPKEETSALIIETILGEGGYVPPPSDYYRRLKKLAEDYGLLLITDEIQSGFGRTGKWWAIEHYDVEPDVICFAKGVASGMPLGGIIAKSDVMDWLPGTHYSTFGGNPVSCAAAIAVLDVMEKEHILENAAKVGDHILKVCREFHDKYPILGDVRGKGLMIGLELVEDRKTKKPAVEKCKKFLIEALKQGILLLRCGMSTIRLIPPLNIDLETVDETLNIMEKIFQKI